MGYRTKNNIGEAAVAESGTVLEQKTEPTVQSGENAAASQAPSLVFGEDDEKYLGSTPSMKRKEILDLFSSEEHSLLVKKLFADDEPAFQGAVTEISLVGTWEEVAQYLDTLYVANEVNPFSTEAILFTDKLCTHFQSPNFNT